MGKVNEKYNDQYPESYRRPEDFVSYEERIPKKRFYDQIWRTWICCEANCTQLSFMSLNFSMSLTFPAKCHSVLRTNVWENDYLHCVYRP